MRPNCSKACLLINVVSLCFIFTAHQNFIPFLCTAPLQYVPKIVFTQAAIDCLTTNKTKNALHSEMIILNYIGGDPISHSLSN